MGSGSVMSVDLVCNRKYNAKEKEDILWKTKNIGPGGKPPG